MASKEEAYRPTNPGSSKHHSGTCKPCNKFNSSRPHDSCKHGSACEFCHDPGHERLKHRGQRGRHALQRRQFMENRGQHPENVNNMIDRIYTEPHEAIEKIKRFVSGMIPSEREEKVIRILEEIRRIGEEAQKLRPDHERLRAPKNTATTEASPSVSELDPRCKWLVGTLHLMARKMMETKPEKDVENAVEAILDEVRHLPDKLQDRAPARGDPAAQARLHRSYGWLQEHLNRLVGRPERGLKYDETLKQIREHCEHCSTGNVVEVEEEEKEHILKSTDLEDLCSRLRLKKSETILESNYLDKQFLQVQPGGAAKGEKGPFAVTQIACS